MGLKPQLPEEPATPNEKGDASFRKRPLFISSKSNQRSRIASISAPTASIAAMPSTRVTMPRAS